MIRSRNIRPISVSVFAELLLNKSGFGTAISVVCVPAVILTFVLLASGRSGHQSSL